jgi:hypothetical protein
MEGTHGRDHTVRHPVEHRVFPARRTTILHPVGQAQMACALDTTILGISPRKTSVYSRTARC